MLAFFFLQEQTVGGLQIRQHPMSASLKPALHAVTCRYKKKKVASRVNVHSPSPSPIHARKEKSTAPPSQSKSSSTTFIFFGFFEAQVADNKKKKRRVDLLIDQ